MATSKPNDTAAKVVLGTGVAAALLGLFSTMGKKPPTPSKPLGKCGSCGR